MSLEKCENEPTTARSTLRKLSERNTPPRREACYDVSRRLLTPSFPARNFLSSDPLNPGKSSSLIALGQVIPSAIRAPPLPSLKGEYSPIAPPLHPSAPIIAAPMATAVARHSAESCRDSAGVSPREESRECRRVKHRDVKFPRDLPIGSHIPCIVARIEISLAFDY